MNLQEHYNWLYSEGIPKIRSGNYLLDHQIDQPNDDRFGITLLVRPSSTVRKNIEALLSKIREVEPDQYFYPFSDIHVTLLTIINCRSGFRLADVDVENYKKTIIKGLLSYSGEPIHIEMKGITGTNSCILAQGFFQNNSLNNIRDHFRSALKNSDLQQDLDSRYSIKGAHSTIVRFKKPLRNPEKLIQLIDENRETLFGSFKVEEIEFVFNDWYQNAKVVKKLHIFPL